MKTKHTRLSVNLNKIALIRNSRGANFPNLLKIASDCERFGAEGITVHPRPDERHVRYSDIPLLKESVTTELNIEGNPNPKFTEMVLQNRPDQVTLVPDAADALTSDAGWDTKKHYDFLKEKTLAFHEKGIRVSIFIDPVPSMIEKAKELGVDRVELYTGPFAKEYSLNRENAVAKYVEAAKKTEEIGLELNAGHDLNLDNLRFFKDQLPNLDEVSIGHALVVDALYYGLENTIQMYLQKLSNI